jgi:hypothetical protein
MSCHEIKTGNSITHICLANIYKYPFQGKEYYLEWHNYMGPMPVGKKTLDPIKTIPKGFWKMVGEFSALSKEDRKKYLISD